MRRVDNWANIARVYAGQRPTISFRAHVLPHGVVAVALILSTVTVTHADPFDLRYLPADSASIASDTRTLQKDRDALSDTYAVGASTPTITNVNAQADDDDLVPGNGFCDSSPGLGFTCNLRAAIQEANAIGGSHTIVVPAGTYTLTRPGDDATSLNGDLDVLTDITIVGTGAATTIIQASATGADSAVDRVFEVLSPGRLTLSGVTVRNGKPVNGLGFGGGISSDPGVPLDLDKVVVTGNSAPSGGGVVARGSTSITNSTIHTNSATSTGGGGLLVGAGGADVTMTNVTLSGNSANSGGGGGLLINVSANGTLNNVTVTGNRASSGGGLKQAVGTVQLHNSIVAGNTGENCAGSITSGGFNVVFPSTACGFDASIGDGIAADPKLGPLADNGGPTPTHAPQVTSLALDRGNPASPLDGVGGRCAAVDQTGTNRAIDGNIDGTVRCDVGAFEAPKAADLSIAKTHLGNFVAGQNGVYTLAVSNAANAGPTAGVIAVTDALGSAFTPVSAVGTGWACPLTTGNLIRCERTTPLAPGTTTSIALTVAVNASGVPGTTNIAQVSVENDINLGNNGAADPTTITPNPCSPRPNVGLVVSRTGAGTGPGKLRATLTANTSPQLPTNGITKVKIVSASNAALDELGGQANVTVGEVAFASVASTSFIVRRLSGAVPNPQPFTVRIEVTDACGVWSTFVGGGSGVQ
jgi:hypothetical protein